MDSLKLGKFLATLRNEKGLTQEKLAELLMIDKRKVSRWETGSSYPEFDYLIKLSEIYDISLYELSICQRVKDKPLIEKYKIKLRKLRDYKLLRLRKKIFIIIGIIIGIFLGLSAIFFIKDYDSVQVYRMVSADNNFKIRGEYIKAQDRQIFMVRNLEYLGHEEDKLNINVNNIQYNVFKAYRRVIHFIPTNLANNQLNLLQNISTLNFSNEKKFPDINEKDDLIFQIIYNDFQKNKNSITFRFKLVKIFSNNTF